MTNGMKPWKMGDFLSVKHGYPFQSEHFATEGHYVVVTPGNFYEAGGFKRIPGKEKYFTAQFPAEYLLKKGDLVVAMTQQTAGLLGSTAIIPADDEYLHNQRIGLISFDEMVVDKLYLYYLFMSRSVRKQIEDSASGTKIKHTSPGKIYDVIVYLPDIVVQKSVGKLLWALEQKITNNACIATELESMAKTLYDYWFVQFDFPDANGKPYRASGGEMVWNEQLKREIPKGWNIATLGDICTFRNGINYDKNEEGDKEYQIINVRNITASTVLLDENELDHICLKQKQADTYRVSSEDIIIARSGTPGATRLINPLNNNTIFCGFIICCHPKVPLQKLFITFSLKRLEGTAATKTGGSILQNVSQDTLKSVQLIVPPESVLENYNELVNTWLLTMQNLVNENRELASLRDWLLPMLMNGQATVAPAKPAPKLQVLQPEKPARDPHFDRWLQTQGVAARGTVDEQTLHDIFDAMDDDDKQ